MVLRTLIVLSLTLLFFHAAMSTNVHQEKEEGKVQDSGWIDINLADDAESEQEGRTDSEATEQELDLNLENADNEEVLADDEEIPAVDEETSDSTTGRESFQTTAMSDDAVEAETCRPLTNEIMNEAVCRLGIPRLVNFANNARIPQIRQGSLTLSRLDISGTSVGSCSAASHIIVLRGVNTQLSGRYRYKPRWIAFKGNFRLRVNDARMIMTFSHRLGANQCPVFFNIRCFARIQRLSVRAHGSLSGIIINLFRGKIANKLRPRLQSVICNAAIRFLQTSGQALLERLLME